MKYTYANKVHAIVSGAPSLFINCSGSLNSLLFVMHHRNAAKISIIRCVSVKNGQINEGFHKYADIVMQMNYDLIVVVKFILIKKKNNVRSFRVESLKRTWDFFWILFPLNEQINQALYANFTLEYGLCHDKCYCTPFYFHHIYFAVFGKLLKLHITNRKTSLKVHIWREKDTGFIVFLFLSFSSILYAEKNCGFRTKSSKLIWFLHI